MGFSNLAANWRVYTCYDVLNERVTSASYDRTEYEPACNKSAPHIHTLKEPLVFILLRSIPWLLVGVLKVGVPALIVWMVVGIWLGNRITISHDRYFLVIVSIASYLAGPASCIKSLMEDEAKWGYVGKRTLKVDNEARASSSSLGL